MGPRTDAPIPLASVPPHHGALFFHSSPGADVSPSRHGRNVPDVLDSDLALGGEGGSGTRPRFAQGSRRLERTFHVATEPCVLIVDDDGETLLALELLLETGVDRVRVRTAAGPQAALEILSQEEVAVLVTDYRMPGMNGGELWDCARRLQPRLAACLISGSREILEDPDVRSAGFDALIAKPFSPDELLRVVERCVGMFRRDRASGGDGIPSPAGSSAH